MLNSSGLLSTTRPSFRETFRTFFRIWEASRGIQLSSTRSHRRIFGRIHSWSCSGEFFWWFEPLEIVEHLSTFQYSFRFMYNQLESLEGNLFEHNPNLRYVSFSTNRLTNVGHGLLDNLPLLEQARFIRNPCIDVDANTPEEIEDLKRELVVSCPPLTTEPTTTEASEYCSAGCSERIAASQRQIIKLQTQNFDLMRRIIKLEETMREILDSPCPCWK